MATGRFRFERFCLDPDERRLRRDDATVELNARYLDALALLVREQGKLVSKDNFLAEVWRGVPVTDEALTQCIRTLRKQLGDSATSPRFIETIPKHGYRFIAPVEWVDGDGAVPTTPQTPVRPAYAMREFLLLGAAGTMGGGLAGLLGGLIYGFAAASQAPLPGTGAVSVLLVLVSLTLLVALLGGTGVAFGIAASGFAPGHRWQWSALGGAAGGLVVGAAVKLLGIDAITLLFGRSPGEITGAAEGVVLGAAVGFSMWLVMRGPGSLRRGVGMAALAGGVGGIVIALLGGQLMGGSLDLLDRNFPDSRLRLDPIGRLFGETGFGPTTRMVTSCAEGMLFAGCVVGAMILAARFHRQG